MVAPFEARFLFLMILINLSVPSKGALPIDVRAEQQHQGHVLQVHVL